MNNERFINLEKGWDKDESNGALSNKLLEVVSLIKDPDIQKSKYPIAFIAKSNIAIERILYPIYRLVGKDNMAWSKPRGMGKVFEKDFLILKAENFKDCDKIQGFMLSLIIGYEKDTWVEGIEDMARARLRVE